MWVGFLFQWPGSNERRRTPITMKLMYKIWRWYGSSVPKFCRLGRNVDVMERRCTSNESICDTPVSLNLNSFQTGLDTGIFFLYPFSTPCIILSCIMKSWKKHISVFYCVRCVLVRILSLICPIFELSSVDFFYQQFYFWIGLRNHTQQTPSANNVFHKIMWQSWTLPVCFIFWKS